MWEKHSRNRLARLGITEDACPPAATELTFDENRLTVFNEN